MDPILRTISSVGGFGTIIERFTRPSDLVLDPFVDGGATALAAVRLGRRFVGIDIDKACVRTTAARLARVPPANGTHAHAWPFRPDSWRVRN